MKGKIVFYEGGHWGPVFDEPYQVIGTFLYWDVGLKADSCDFYITEALAVAELNSPAGESCGNGHIVRLTPTWVLIANIHIEDISPVIISMDAYLSALRYWKSLIGELDGVHQPNRPPEFNYDDPDPKPLMSPAEAQTEMRTTLLHWRGYEPPHHISQLDQHGTGPE